MQPESVTIKGIIRLSDAGAKVKRTTENGRVKKRANRGGGGRSKSGRRKYRSSGPGSISAGAKSDLVAIRGQ